MNKRLLCLAQMRALVFLAALSMVAGCAMAPDPADKDAALEFLQINDPIEPANRAVFELNRGLDSSVLKPVSITYRGVAPEFLRTRISNFIDNLRAPVILANDILQGELSRAVVTFLRFAINSTLGVGGINDMATALDIEGHDEDFGQTLAVWGIGEGPFIMLPLFGPSNPRDTVGLVVDFLIDPLNIWSANTGREYVPWARSAMVAVDTRSQNIEILDDLENSSLDFYAAIRSLYRQRRADAISNGQGSAKVPAPSLGELPDSPTFGATDELSRR